MKTKTLLIAIAIACAFEISSSQAQVFSQNIVGYVNVPMVGNIAAFSLPLDLANGNAATNVFPNVYNPSFGYGPMDGDILFIWNGAGFNSFAFDSLKPTGFGTLNDAEVAPTIAGISVPTPTINPGVMVYVDDANGAFTNTVVGTVHVDVAATGSQTVGTTTNLVGGNLQFEASKLPIAGGIESVLQVSNVYNAANQYGPLDGDTLYVPIIGHGGFTGYSEYAFDSLKSTGFGNAADAENSPTTSGVTLPEPQIPVGGGFVIDAANGPFTWTQSY